MTLSGLRRAARTPLSLLVLLASSAASAQETIPFRIPEGWKARKFADHPMLGNPVAFCLDERGRIFVAEEYRFNRGTEENRTRPFFLEDDLRIKTLDDRLAMYRKWASKFEGGMDWFTRHADQVRMIEDRDGDGRADRSTIFAGGFNGTLDGLAAGVIARDGDVYLTCIPNLWRLRDKDGDGVADSREVLQTGFGVNAGFLGHDLHGLVWGPDGKLYFSIGDRGFNLKTREGKSIVGPRRGGVFRCEPDGSEMELVAQGMRNPQELAFDAYGNLFAVDNNCDKGDDARLVHVVEGGDSGWNMAYQTIPSPYLTGPWHAEKLWHLAHPGQAAYIVPPAGKIGVGPSGFAAYPGVGLPDRYKDGFFYCNFTVNGGVEAFGVKPKGASFEMRDLHPVVTGVMATDVDFGYDGRVYLSDYGKLEWDGSNNDGRIYAVESSALVSSKEAAGVSALFREGFRGRSDRELLDLLAHPDMRVRGRAQAELASRGDRLVPALKNVLDGSKDRFARLHALWCLGRIGRTSRTATEAVAERLGDGDPILRAWAARIAGESGFAPAVGKLVESLRDSDDHVKFSAAVAIGRVGGPMVVPNLIALIRENDDRDPYIRHAGVMGILGAGGDKAVDSALAHAGDASRAVRLAVVLVCRRRADARIARFVNDPEYLVRVEAARAINDLPIDEAAPALARTILEPKLRNGDESFALTRRTLNANLRGGGAEQAEAVAKFAADEANPGVMREEAVEILSTWTAPLPRDRVNGFWREIAPRSPSVIQTVATDRGGAILAAARGELRAKVVDLLDRSGAGTPTQLIGELVDDPKEHPRTRAAGLRFLVSREASDLNAVLTRALKDADPGLRSEARRVLAKRKPDDAAELLAAVVVDGSLPFQERQAAADTLGDVVSPKVDSFVAKLVDDVTADKLAPAVRLEVIEAARKRKSEAVARALREHESARRSGDPLADFLAALAGGDAGRGRSIFIDNPQAQCVRCHRIQNQGGTTGPNLSELAKRSNPEAILHSLVDPDATIAPGYGRTSIGLLDGRIVEGMVKSESDRFIELENINGRIDRIAVADVDERTPPRSAMPKVTQSLSLREIRDLVAYLSTLK